MIRCEYPLKAILKGDCSVILYEERGKVEQIEFKVKGITVLWVDIEVNYWKYEQTTEVTVYYTPRVPYKTVRWYINSFGYEFFYDENLYHKCGSSVLWGAHIDVNGTDFVEVCTYDSIKISDFYRYSDEILNFDNVLTNEFKESDKKYKKGTETQ